jgi:hypothetical protein
MDILRKNKGTILDVSLVVLLLIGLAAISGAAPRPLIAQSGPQYSPFYWDCENKCNLPEKGAGCLPLETPVDCTKYSNNTVCGFKIDTQYILYNCKRNPNGTGTLQNCNANTGEGSCYMEHNCVCFKIDLGFFVKGAPVFSACVDPLARTAFDSLITGIGKIKIVANNPALKEINKFTASVLYKLRLTNPSHQSAKTGCSSNCPRNAKGKCN